MQVQDRQTPPPQQQIPLPSPVMPPPKSPSGRKNLWIVLSIVGAVIIIAAVIIVTVLLLGSGGNTSKAKEHMLKANKLTRQLKTDAQTWSDDLSSSLSEASDEKAWEAGVEKAKAGAADLSTGAGKVKVEFEAIKDLSGVENYVKVADLEISEMDNLQELMIKTDAFLDKMLVLVKASDVAGMESLGKSYADETSKIVSENKKLEAEAQKIVADKNLL